MGELGDQIGGDLRELTKPETAFLAAILPDRPWLHVWRHEDADGTPWLIVSLDIAQDGAIARTWRLDFDGDSILGGRSPAFLNWDSGVRARAAGIDGSSEEEVQALGSPTHLAQLGARWFDERHRLGLSS
jgi:hypothetical protein